MNVKKGSILLLIGLLMISSVLGIKVNTEYCSHEQNDTFSLPFQQLIRFEDAVKPYDDGYNFEFKQDISESDFSDYVNNLWSGNTDALFSSSKQQIILNNTLSKFKEGKSFSLPQNAYGTYRIINADVTVCLSDKQLNFGPTKNAYTYSYIHESNSKHISIYASALFVKTNITKVSAVAWAKSRDKDEPARAEGILGIYKLDLENDKLEQVVFLNPRIEAKNSEKTDMREFENGLEEGLYIVFLVHFHEGHKGFLDNNEDTAIIIKFEDTSVQVNTTDYIFSRKFTHDTIKQIFPDSDANDAACHAHGGSFSTYKKDFEGSYRCCRDDNTPLGKTYVHSGKNYECTEFGWENKDAKQYCEEKGGDYLYGIADEDTILNIKRLTNGSDGCCGDDDFKITNYIIEPLCVGDINFSSEAFQDKFKANNCSVFADNETNCKLYGCTFYNDECKKLYYPGFMGCFNFDVDNCPTEYGCKINEGFPSVVSSTGDYGYVDPTGSYFCDKNKNGNWTWRSANAHQLGTIFNVFNSTEAIVTNNDKWFVCDANNDFKLNFFKGLNFNRVENNDNIPYNLTMNEFETFQPGTKTIGMGKMFCVDALNAYGNFTVDFEHYDDAEYQNAYCNEVSFNLLDMEGFSTCLTNCFISGESLVARGFSEDAICSSNEFKNLPFCRAGITLADILKKKSDCSNPMNCMSDVLDPSKSCGEQGLGNNKFNYYSVCDSGQFCSGGSLIKSTESGQEGSSYQCCVSDRNPVVCKDTGTLTESVCIQEGGTVITVQEMCNPDELKFGILGDEDKFCCFGFAMPVSSLWANVYPTEKFSCYKTSFSNEIAECCYDGSCVNTDKNIMRGLGSRLHQITGFDTYSDDGKFNDMILTLKAKNEEMTIFPSYIEVYNWEGFDTLEFNIAATDFERLNISISNGTSGYYYPLGRLTDFLVTGNELGRWQKVVVILPKNDTLDREIDYSNIKKIIFHPTESFDYYHYQILVDDMYLNYLPRFNSSLAGGGSS